MHRLQSLARAPRRKLETTLRRLGLLGLIAAAGCSGSGSETEPLISGSVTLGYAGQPYTVAYGFAAVHAGDQLIGLGTDPLDCDSVNSQDPPAGTSAVVTLSTLAPGTYNNVAVELIHNVGDFEFAGDDSGTVTITDTSADSVAGSVTFAKTDSNNLTYHLDGTFEVHHCP